MTTRTEEWDYSVDAINVLDRFHSSNYVVFVEGENDVIFWSSLFEKAGREDFYIKPVGGINELKKIMSDILSEDARVIVACDSDYSTILNNLPVHVRIISTYGYSIENTLFCPLTINSVINKLSRSIENRIERIQEWVDYFCDALKVLIIYDIAREKYQKPIVVCGNNCTRFLKTNRSNRVSEEATACFILTIDENFSKEEIDESTTLLDKCDLDLRYVIKGHFITVGVINLIKSMVKRHLKKYPTISIDTFYALTSDGCKKCDQTCLQSAVLEEKINKAVSSLQLI